MPWQPRRAGWLGLQQTVGAGVQVQRKGVGSGGGGGGGLQLGVAVRVAMPPEETIRSASPVGGPGWGPDERALATRARKRRLLGLCADLMSAANFRWEYCVSPGPVPATAQFVAAAAAGRFATLIQPALFNVDNVHSVRKQATRGGRRLKQYNRLCSALYRSQGAAALH